MRSTLRKIKEALRYPYFEDGMATSHIADFLSDPKFVRAYQLGRDTGSWRGSELRWRAYTACWCAVQALSLEGDFVECGVNRGGLSRTIVEYVNFGEQPRRFILVDTFKGDPDVNPVNQGNYHECYDDVVRTFSPFPNVSLIRGRIPESLSQITSEKVSYLSLDMNNPVPEVAALRCLWERLVPGALVLLDDYSYSEHYRTTKTAMDDLGTELNFSVLCLPTGQGLVIKI